MGEKSFNMNFEIFFSCEEDAKKSILNDTTKVIRVFEFKDKDNVICYEHALDKYSKSNVVQTDVVKEEIERDEYKKQYRKHFHTRMFSELGHIEPVSYGNHRISARVDFIRGPVTVVLAYVSVTGTDKPTDEILKNINTYLQEAIPLSINGKITATNPAKISLNRSNYVMPVKKVLPKFAHIKYCKFLSNYINPEIQLLFEYKWIKLMTGVILVWERYDELINVLTGNKIDPMYIEQSWPALDTDMLVHILNNNSFEIEFNKGKDVSDQLGDELRYQINEGLLMKNVINDRVKSYHMKRISFVDGYEKVRNAKRALNNMGKDLIDTLS